MTTEEFYLAFENEFRGAENEIRERQSGYLKYVLPLKEFSRQAKALDIGCGRGEWLELLVDKGFTAKGIDINKAIISKCQSKGLHVEISDGLSALEKSKDESYCLITGFHIIEHMKFEEVLSLIREAKRCLIPGGLLILETPNPEAISVGSCDFYLDPTHIRPVHPLLLSFATRYEGFTRTKIHRLSELSNCNASSGSLFDVIYGASRDYSVICQKAGCHHAEEILNDAFREENGITTLKLVEIFDKKDNHLWYIMEHQLKRLNRKVRKILGWDAFIIKKKRR